MEGMVMIASNSQLPEGHPCCPEAVEGLTLVTLPVVRLCVVFSEDALFVVSLVDAVVLLTVLDAVGAGVP
jgi:hypothetical protein